MRFTATAAVLWLLVSNPLSAHAQTASSASNYPNRPVRVLVGFAPGGTTDITARILAAHLTQSWGQQFVVDNRTGASGQIATDIVAKAAPDGYTLFAVAGGTHTSNVSLYKKLPYDTVKDLAPITLFAWVSNMIVTHPSTPINSLQDLIRLAKAQPGKLTYATPGTGTVAHLSAEMLKSLTGTDIVHVPYKGGGPALAAIASNEVTIMFAALPSATPFVQAKRIKPLAVTSPKRAPQLPDVPTVAEAGLPKIEVMEWYGVLAPARTPPAIINKLRDEIVKIIQKPEVAKRLTDLGADPVVTTPAQFAKQIESDIQMWANVIKQAGIQAD